MRYAVTMPVLALSCALGLAQAVKPAKPTAETAPIDTSTVEKILRGDEAVDAGQGFTYDPAGRRDPFRSLLAGQLREELGQRPPGLRGMGIDEIRLEGLIKLREGYVAMVQGTDNLAYLVRPGTVLYDGYVDRIEPGRLVFKMQVADPKSLKPYREVTRTLQ
jgi:hypothetical protein